MNAIPRICDTCGAPFIGADPRFCPVCHAKAHAGSPLGEEVQFDNPSAPNYDWQKDREWFNQRLANARIHNSELEQKLAVARTLLMEAREWKRKGYPVMRQRIDEFIGTQSAKISEPGK